MTLKSHPSAISAPASLSLSFAPSRMLTHHSTLPIQPHVRACSLRRKFRQRRPRARRGRRHSVQHPRQQHHHVSRGISRDAHAREHQRLSHERAHAVCVANRYVCSAMWACFFLISAAISAVQAMGSRPLRGALNINEKLIRGSR